MARTITAGEALGHRLMRASCKEEVIQYLAAADVPAPNRRRWYREWCRATLSKCHAEDLDRCAPPARSRERNAELVFEDSPGHGAGQALTEQPHVALSNDKLSSGAAPKTATAPRAATASMSGE